MFWKREYHHHDDWMASRQKAIKVLQVPYDGTCGRGERWDMSTGGLRTPYPLGRSRMYGGVSFYLMQQRRMKRNHQYHHCPVVGVKSDWTSTCSNRPALSLHVSVDSYYLLSSPVVVDRCNNLHPLPSYSYSCSCLSLLLFVFQHVAPLHNLNHRSNRSRKRQ